MGDLKTALTYRRLRLVLSRVTAAAVFAVAPIACASNSTIAVAEAVKPGTSLVGNYLAGRHAQSVRDTTIAADMLMAALALDPDNVDLQKRAFVATLVDGRMDAAISLAKPLSGPDVSMTIAHLVMAVDDVKAGRFDAALKQITKLKSARIYSFLTPMLDAWALMGDGKPDAAVAALKPMQKRSGLKALADLHVALVHDLAGNVAQADTHYQAVKNSPSGLSLRLAQLMGSFHHRQGNTAAATALYDLYRKEHPGSRLIDGAQRHLTNGSAPVTLIRSAADGTAEALMGIAGALNSENTRETAEIFARLSLYLRDDLTMTKVLLAGFLEDDQRFEAANAIYKTVPQTSPLSYSTRLRAADNMDQLDQTEQATAVLAGLAAERPDDPDPLIDLGDVLRRHEQFEDAVVAYTDAIKRIGTLEKRHWSLLYSRAIAYERSKDWPSAEADFLQALEFQPNQPLVLNYLGYTWVEKGQNLERAQDMIRKAVSLRPGDGYIVDSLGWVLFQVGKAKESVKEMERAVELRPQDPVINDHLGDVYWTVGRKREAVFQWKRALSLEPEAHLIDVIRGKIKHGLTTKPSMGDNG